MNPSFVIFTAVMNIICVFLIIIIDIIMNISSSKFLTKLFDFIKNLSLGLSRQFAWQYIRMINNRNIHRQRHLHHYHHHKFLRLSHFSIERLKGWFSSGTEFEIIFKPLGYCIIFEIKYNLVILELIGQPYFYLKRNNSQNVWNKCLINCFRINSLSSILKDKTTHLLIQNCFHVVLYILGTQYLHVRHPGKDKSFRTCI